MKRITEQQIRKVIREEIKSYLLEQEKPKKDDKPKFQFRKIITSTAVALLGFFAGTSYNPEVQAVIPAPIEDIGSGSGGGGSDGSGLEKISNLIDETYKELIKLGATDQYAQSLVSRTVEYGNIEFEIRVKETGIKDENRGAEYVSFMLSRFSALQNPEALSKVAAQDFLQQAQSVGTHRIMSTQIDPKTGKTSIGTPIPSYSLQVAFAYEMLTIVEEEEKLPEKEPKVYTEMIVASFNKQKNAYIVIPTILPFFQQVAKEGSPFQKAILDVMPQVSVDASIFEEEQNNNAMEKINKGLGATVRNKKSVEENKVNKLRQKINELRGVYV